MTKSKPAPVPEQDVQGIGYLNYLRRIEQAGAGKPRIGKSTALKQETVAIGQDPFMGFPQHDFQRITQHKRGVPEVRNHIIGFFGAQGALPLDITEETYRWVRNGDMAFVRFTDIFATRFQQLFYRAWSDSRAITQFDHPDGDRFATYVGALLGIGTPAYRDRDDLEDLNKLALAPLAVGRVKSPKKLQQMIEADLGADVWVEEHVPVWIAFEEDAQNALGMTGSTLGQDTYLGARVQSVEEKIVIHIHTPTLAEYRAFLPGGESYTRLHDIVAWYLGVALEVSVSLSLPAGEVQLAEVGKSAELGWMAVMPSNDPPAPDEPVQGATYALTDAA